MACEVNEGIARSIYSLSKKVKEENPNLNGVELFNTAWDRLYDILKSDPNVDNNDIETYYKFLVSTFIDSYDIKAISSDGASYQKLLNLFKNPDFEHVTRKTESKGVITNINNTPTDDVDVNVSQQDNVSVGFSDNVPKSIVDGTNGRIEGTLPRDIVVKYFNEVFDTLNEYKNNPNASTIDLLNKLSDIFNSAKDEFDKVNKKYKNYGFSTFYGEIFSYITDNNIFGQKVKNESIIRRCIQKLKADIADNKDEKIELTNYLINVNNAFYNKSYSKTGLHQGIFKIIDNLARSNDKSITYRSMTVEKFYDLFMSDTNKDLYIAGEIKEFNEDTNESKIPIRLRQFVNLVVDNIDKPEEGRMFDMAINSNNTTIKETFARHERESSRKPGIYIYETKQTCYDILLSDDNNAKKELLGMLSNTGLVIVVPFSENNIFSVTNPIGNTELGKFEKSVYETYDVKYNKNTRLNETTKKTLSRENLDNTIEEARINNTVVFPLHSANETRIGIATEDSVNTLNNIVDNTKEKGEINVDVEYTEGPVNSYTNDTNYVLFKINAESLKLASNTRRLSGEPIDIEHNKHMVLVTHKVDNNGNVIPADFEFKNIVGNNNKIPAEIIKMLKDEKFVDKYDFSLETYSDLNQFFTYVINNIYKVTDLTDSQKKSKEYTFKHQILNILGTYFSGSSNVNVNTMKIIDTGRRKNSEGKSERYSKIITFNNNITGLGHMASYILNAEGVEFFNNYVDINDNDILFECYALPEYNLFTKYSYDIFSFVSTENEVNDSGVLEPTKTPYTNGIDVMSRKNVFIFESKDANIKEPQIERQNTITENEVNKTTTNASTPTIDRSASRSRLQAREKFQSKVYGMSIDAVEEDARQALDWFNDSPLSKLVGINKAFMYADNKGFAKIHLAIKTLADGTKVTTPEIVLEQGSDYTSLYHESWHELTQFCMTQNERDELYSELRKLNGTFKEYENGNKVKFSEATDVQLEELLAESFRHYMLTGKLLVDNNLTFVQNNKKKTILQFFKEVWEQIKWHIKKFAGVDVANPSSATPIIDEMFGKLKNGNVSDYISRFDIENRQYDELHQSLFYADQAMIDLVSLDDLTDDGYNKLARLYYSKNNVEITSENSNEKIVEFISKYNQDEKFRNEIYQFVIDNNITPATADFEGELTNGETKFIGTVKVDGLYGLSENMSTYLMTKLKDIYADYILAKSKENGRGFLQTLLMQNSLQDFFENYLPTLQQSAFGYSANDYIVRDFVIANITPTTLDVNGHKMGLWIPFVDYIKKELKDTSVEFEDIATDEDDGKETYAQRDDIKSADNSKSMKEMIKGQIRFVLSLVKKRTDSTEYVQRMNAVVSRIKNLIDYRGGHNGPEKLYKYIFENRNDEYISQIIDILGYPPINIKEFKYNENDNSQVEYVNALKSANYDYDINQHSQYDIDRVLSWNLFAESFSTSIQTPVLQSINISEYDVNEDVDTEGQGNNYDYGYEYDFDESFDEQDTSTDEKKTVAYFSYSLKLDDQQDREVGVILNNKLKNIKNPGTHNFDELGVTIITKVVNNISTVSVSVNFANIIKSGEGIVPTYGDIFRILNNSKWSDGRVKEFFNSFGIDIKETPVSNDIISKYGKSMVASAVSSIYNKVYNENVKLGYTSYGVNSSDFFFNVDNIFDIIKGANFIRIAKIMKAQEDIFSSFAAYNGENNLNNRYALNSYMTQISAILNDEDFKSDVENMSAGQLKKKYSYMSRFIDSPYWKLFITNGNYLNSLLKNESVVVRGQGVQRLIKGTFRNGAVPFREDQDIKYFSNMYLAKVANIYTPIQWADKEPALAICAVGEDGAFVDPLVGYDTVFNALLPIIDCELQRIRKTKTFFDNPSMVYTGNRNYLEKGQNVSFVDKFLNVDAGDGELVINKLLNYSGSVSSFFNENEGILNIVKDKYDEFVKELINDAQEKIGSTMFDNIRLMPSGRYVSNEVRNEIKKYDSAKFTNETLLRDYVQKNFLMGIYECILLTGDMSNYDNFSKRNGPIISTGILQQKDRFKENALNMINVDKTDENNINDFRSYASVIGLAKGDYDIVRSYDRVVVVDDIITSSTFNELTSELIGDNYQKMETANAIGYITFDSYKRRLQKSNKWTKEQERLYQIILRNAKRLKDGNNNLEPISEQDVNIHFQPLKFQIESPISSSQLDERTLLKNMYFPLIPTAIQGTGLETLHEIMMKDSIDMITVKNGSKLNEKTDHQGDLSSLFKFGYYTKDNKNYWNDKVLNDSLRYINIFLSGSGNDIVKNNGKSAIDRLKVNGKFYDENGDEVGFESYVYNTDASKNESKVTGNIENAVEVIYTDTVIPGTNQTEILKVVRNEEGIGLIRCKLNGTKLEEISDGKNISYDDKTRSYCYNGNVDDKVVISDNSFTVESKYFRDQLVIHSQAGNTISYYTQLRTQITSNMFEHGELIDDNDKYVVGAFEQAFKNLVEFNKNEVYKRICKTTKDGKLIFNDKNYPIIDENKIIAYIKKEADMSKDVSQEAYKSINADNIVDFMNNSIYSSTITKLLIGRLSKDLVNIKVYGDNLKQAPDLLFDKVDIELDNIINQLVDKNSFNDVKVGNIEGLQLIERDRRKRLQSNGMLFESDASQSGFYSVEQIGEYQEMNPSKVQITFCDEFKNLKYHRIIRNYAEDNGISIEDLNNDIHLLCNVVNACLDIRNNYKKGQTNIDESRLLFTDKDMDMFRLVGVRIPTQGYNFMDFMEVGRFIDPTLGPMIILSKEMVEKNGSDYDVDSMPISFPHIGVDKQYTYKDGKLDVIESCVFANDKFSTTINESIGDLNRIRKLLVDTINGDKDATRQRIDLMFRDVFKKIKKNEPEVEGNVVKLYCAVVNNSEDKNKVKEVNSIFNISREVYDTFITSGGSLSLLFNYSLKSSTTNGILEMFNDNKDKPNESTKSNIIKAFDKLIATADKDYDNYVLLCNEIESLLLAGSMPDNEKAQNTRVLLQNVQNELNELYGQKKNVEKNILENELLTSTYNLLKAKTNWETLLKKSDTHLFTNDGGEKESIFNEYRDSSKKYMSPKDFGKELNNGLDESTLTSTDKVASKFNEFVRSSNNVSMTALGIAAVAAKWSVVWRRIGIELKLSFETINGNTYDTTLLLDHDSSKNGSIRLGGMKLKGTKGVDDFDKSEIHDELISGFVDGAKDPWPSLLNFNIATIPVVEFLFWSGCRRDDVISLVNYDSVKNYVKGIQSHKKGLSKFALGSTKIDNKTRINDFFKNSSGVMSGKLQKCYNDVLAFYDSKKKTEEGKNLKYPSFYDFAFSILNAVDSNSFDRKNLAANMIKSNGKEEKFKELGYGSLFKNINTYVTFKKDSNTISVCGISVDLNTALNGKLDYDDLALLQYMMAEKMSNDVTNFTTTFEADKNSYKSTAELAKYNSLFDEGSGKRSVVNYKETFDKLVGKEGNPGTTLGITFYNDVLSEVYSQFVNKFGKEGDVKWRENSQLNQMLFDRISGLQNGREFYENIEGAKDKIFDYFFQNQLARRRVVESRTATTDEEIELVRKNNGYYVSSDNGIMTYVYDDNTMYQMYDGQKSSFSCYDEFRNFIFKRDDIYNRYNKKGTTLINEIKKDNVSLEDIKTQMSGDILYDMILNNIFSKFVYIDSVEPTISNDNVNTVITSAFETYCYVRSQMEVYNYAALFDKNNADGITYAELVGIITNNIEGLISKFPGLGSLFKVNSYNGKTSLQLTKVLDNNTSNDQFGDENSQFMDIMTGPYGIQNKGVLMSALSSEDMPSTELNNRVDSILWIIGLFQIYCQLQAGSAISGQYGIAKFGNDNFRKSITKDAIRNFMKNLTESETSLFAQAQLDRILKFKMSDTLGETQETFEPYVARDFTGECFVDELYSQNRTQFVYGNEMYNIINPVKGVFSVQNKNNAKLDDYDIIRGYIQNEFGKLLPTILSEANNGVMMYSREINVDYIVDNRNRFSVYTYYNGNAYRITYERIGDEKSGSLTSKIEYVNEDKYGEYETRLRDNAIGLKSDSFIPTAKNYMSKTKDEISNEVDTGMIGGTKEVRDTVTISINGGNSIELVVNKNGYGKRVGTGNITLSNDVNTLVDVLIGKNTDKVVKYSEIPSEDISLFDKYITEGNMDNYGTNRMFFVNSEIISNDGKNTYKSGDLFVKFADRIFKVSTEVKKNEDNTISRFMDNIYVYNGSFYSNESYNVKKGGFTIVMSINELIANAVMKDKNVLMDKNLMESIMSDKNKLNILASAMNVQVNTKFGMKKTNTSVEKTDNKNQCK